MSDSVLSAMNLVIPCDLLKDFWFFSFSESESESSFDSSKEVIEENIDGVF